MPVPPDLLAAELIVPDRLSAVLPFLFGFLLGFDIPAGNIWLIGVRRVDIYYEFVYFYVRIPLFNLGTGRLFILLISQSVLQESSSLWQNPFHAFPCMP